MPAITGLTCLHTPKETRLSELTEYVVLSTIDMTGNEKHSAGVYRGCVTRNSQSAHQLVQNTQTGMLI